MSKMPAKKRSCFQITSVTVTAAGAADDSESQDDPDDSRTEDVSRAACDSSSEEALNNVGELEADSVVPPSSVPHAGQESAPSSKPSVELRKVGVSGSSQGGQQASGIDAASASQAGPVQQPASSVGVLVNAAQPAAVNNSALPLLATCSVSCISRFKVIRLDHCTTGEPFRRGRWKCAECYVKDSESSVVGQTVESMRHASTTLDPAADSDSGLGLTGGLMVSSAAHSSHGLGSMAHASLSSTHVETHLPQQQQIHHQNYSTRQKGVSGATDDSESLDDLDESRTEDVSPKIYNMSRAVCNSSSEEALNNVGEPEAVSVMQPSSVPHAGQESALSSKPSVELRKVGVSGLSRGGQQASGIDIASGLQTGPVQHQRQQPASPANVLVNTAQPAAVTVSAPLPPTSTVSCVSRFKVIRLDDGTTAQPFRRGRWKCVEFIDKDSESAVVGQTVESMRHASTTLDPAADRDSGLGLTGGSKVSSAAHSSHGLGSMAHASLSSTRIETHLPQQQQIHHQNYSTRQKGVSGAAAADDSESLGDSGESWTEEVLEICDVSEAACDSSAKEALNNVGEPETVSVMPSSSVPHASQQSVLSSNPSVEFQKVGVSGLSQGCQQASGIDVITQAGLVQPASSASVLVNAAQPAAVTTSAPHPATSTVSYISRFKVIKLDDGTTVQPFKKGRRRSTELNEKDPESSVVPPHPSQQQQIHHQNYSAHQKGVSGSATHNSFSNIKPTAVPAQPAVGGLQPLSTQNVLPVEQNSPPQSGVHIQKSPIMPLSAQPSPYPPQQQQVPVSQHLTSQSPGLIQNQTEYYQQHQSASMQPVLASGQSFPVSTQGKGPTSVMPTASRGASVPSQVGDVAGAGGGSVPAGQPAPAVLQQQAIGMGGSVLVGESSMKQQTVNQYASAGQSEPHGHPTFSGVQNVPAITVSSSVPPTVPTAVPSASSAAMPNVTTPSLPPGQTPHSKTIVVLGAQGLPVTGFGQVEVGGGRKSEGPVNAQSPVVSTKEPAKPFMPESLQLTTPTVNSPVDGEEDRNPSKAFYRAFQSGSRLRDSKVHSDSASGTNVVAIDNKIEQAMDLVKSHLMYAVREEVEVLKVQIKELHERNSVLERENAMLKSLANSEQLSQLSAQSAASSSASPSQQRRSQPQHQAQPPLQVQPQSHPQLQHHPKPQQLQTQPQLDPVQKLQTNVTSA